MLGGIAVSVAAKSAIHEILGAISFGLGAVCLGLAAIIERLDKAMKRERAPIPPPENQLTNVEAVPAGGWKRQS